MQYLKYSSQVILVVNQHQDIEHVSQGALEIGLQSGQQWVNSGNKVVQVAQQDYLVGEDQAEDGHFVIYLHPLEKQQRLDQALELISQCKLTDLPKVSGRLGSTMRKAVSTLNEAIKQSLDASVASEQGADELLDSANQLSDRTTSVASQLEETLSATKQLEESIALNLHATHDLSDTMTEIDKEIATGKSSVQQAFAQIAEIVNSVTQTQGIVSVIDEIAFKTNMLSLNAAVEAARAGEAGRGFSIVAKEVRDLAGHSSRQADEIRALLKSTAKNAQSGHDVMDIVNQSLEQLFTKLDGINKHSSQIRETSEDQNNAIRESAATLDSITRINEQNAVLADSLTSLASKLQDQTKHMRDAMEVFEVEKGFSHVNHQAAFACTKRAAELISKRFELAIQRGEISQKALFAREYTEVPGTDPVRYNSDFDRFCDQVLPDIQEPLLADLDFTAYLIAIDENGYVPTHNNQFCQPLTGDPKVDLAANRTKRIFTDRVGQSSGSHQSEYLLLTYRRDTGEVLNDISCPIYVDGKHWGGVRCGYRLT